MKILFISILTIISFGLSELNADTGEFFTIGFFEGGESVSHGAFRRQFRDQLSVPNLTNKRIIFVPEGFKTAAWNRGKSKELAAEFAADKSIELVVALGPWTVEDLLEAGFDRPILAAVRFNPVAEQLIDQSGRPIVDNLTVRIRPNKISSDIEYLFSLIPIKKLGFLQFPSGDDNENILAEVKKAANRYGAEVETASGYNINGAFAFFKAYQALGKDIDALYLAPLWGFTPEKTRQFFNMTIRDRVPTFSAEGEYDVTRGAMAAGSVETARERARYHVWKVIQIINGAVPADLPITMSDISGLTVNDFVANSVGMKRDGRYIHQAVLIESPPSDNIEHLTLSGAIGLGLSQNPDYLSRYELLEAAQKAVAEVSSRYLPQVSVGMSAYKNRFYPSTDNNRFYSYDDYNDNTNNYFAAINLKQTILSLTTIKDIKIASERKKSVDVDYRKATLDLELGINLGCIEHIRARQLQAIEISTLKNIRQSVNVALINTEIGEGEVADQLRLESEWLKSNRKVFKASARRDISHQLLNIILGRPGSIDFYLSDKDFSRNRITGQTYQFQTLLTNRDKITTAVNHLATLAEKSNPELEAVNVALAISNLEISKNKANWLPKIGFQATLAYNSVDYPLSNEKYYQPNKDEFRSWAVGAELSWSIFQGGQRVKRAQRLNKELQAIQYQADNKRLQISGRIERSLLKLKALAESYPLAVRSSELSDEYLTSALDNYNMGTMPLVGLLDAIDNNHQSAIELINIYFDFFAESSRLTREIGLSPYENNSSAGQELVAILSTLYE